MAVLFLICTDSGLERALGRDKRQASTDANGPARFMGRSGSLGRLRFMDLQS